MYHLAIVTLIGLAALKVTDLVIENVPGLDRVRTLFTFALAIVCPRPRLLRVRGVRRHGTGRVDGHLGTGLVVGSLATAWCRPARVVRVDLDRRHHRIAQRAPAYRRLTCTPSQPPDGASMERRHRLVFLSL